MGEGSWRYHAAGAKAMEETGREDKSLKTQVSAVSLLPERFPCSAGITAARRNRARNLSGVLRKRNDWLRAKRPSHAETFNRTFALLLSALCASRKAWHFQRFRALSKVCPLCVITPPKAFWTDIPGTLAETPEIQTRTLRSAARHPPSVTTS